MATASKLIWSLATRTLLLIGPAACGQAQEIYGIIQTTTEQRLEGSIRLDNDAFYLTDDQGHRHVVPLADLSSFVPAQPRPANVEHETPQLHGLNGDHLKTPEEDSSQSPAPPEGWLAMYFNRPNLDGPFLAVTNETIDFNWRNREPAQGINKNRFSVRWIGKLSVPETDPYAFHLECGDGARLWIDEDLILDHWRNGAKSLVSNPVTLEKGQIYNFKCEVFSDASDARARLFWSSPRITRSIVPSARVRPVAPPLEQDESPHSISQPPGVWLTDGSFLARPVFSVDGNFIRFSRSTGEPTLALANAARIHFQEVPEDRVEELESGRPGLLLKTGDFLDGEMKKLENSRVELNSVLLGRRTFRSNQILAAVFKKVSPETNRFEIRTKSHSLYRVNHLQLMSDRLEFLDPPLRGFTENAGDVAEIRRVP